MPTSGLVLYCELGREEAVWAYACRSCSGRSGHLVLDLGNQPACDHFPGCHDPGPDPSHPLQMWLCSSCGLAQLVGEPTVAEEPLGTEPAGAGRIRPSTPWNASQQRGGSPGEAG